MLSVRGAVRRSLHSSLSAEKTKKRELELQAVGNPLKRQALLGAHALSMRFPRPTARLLRLGYPDVDLAEFAHGTNSDVYRYGKGDLLLKVVKNTAKLSDNERTKQLYSMRQDHAALRRHLGDMVLPHVIFVARHPLERRRYAIQILQPLVDVEEVKLFIPSHAALNKDGFTDLLGRSESMPLQLQNLTEASHDLHDNSSGLLPDFNGVANFGTDKSGKLILVDSQPVIPQDPGHGLAMRQLVRLENALMQQAA